MGKITKLKADIKEYANADNILIYQMGKVGSTSLEETIKGSLHVHSLYSNWPCFVFYRQRRSTLIARTEQHLYDLSRRIALNQRDKIKIISLVRNPYGRNISMFFQNLPHWIYYFSVVDKKDLRLESDTSLLYEIYERAFDHDYELTWFDKELKRFTGIDIYNYPFDKEKGWSVINEGKYEILLLKLEKLESAWSAVEDFVGYKLEYKNVNTSGDKWYSDIYNKFVKGYIPDKKYLEKLFGSKMAKHFYTDSELEKFTVKALKQESK